MNLLLDSCVSWRVAAGLAQEGHQAEAAMLWENDPGDAEILKIAYNTSRVLVTLDRDYGELVFLYGRPHSGILYLKGFPSGEHLEACLAALQRYGPELAEGALVVFEPDASRVRHRQQKPD